MRLDPGSAASPIPDIGTSGTSTPPSLPSDGARSRTLSALRELVEVVRPVTMAGERVVPVDESLEELLDGGLRRGSTVRVEGSVGVTSLGLSLCARATSSGLWMGCLNIPSIGWAAAEAVGVDLCRVVSVDVPAADVVDAVAAMVDVFDLVMCDGLGGVSHSQLTKLSARVRERGCVLLVLDGQVRDDRRSVFNGGSAGGHGWPDGYVRADEAFGIVDVVLEVQQVLWSGLGDGRGRLRSRSVDVVAHGRRGLASPRFARVG